MTTAARQNPGDIDRMMDLLAQRATEGLSAPEASELALLLAENPGIDADAFDLAAAAVSLSSVEPAPMPESLRERIEADAAVWLGAALTGREAFSHDAPFALAPIAGPIRRTSAIPWIAAAACLVLAASAWLRIVPLSSGHPSFDQLIARPDTVRTAWAKGPDYTGQKITGEVVWNDAAQTGYLVFKGLPKLDPAQHVYQLWIFDPTRDERYPVSGAMFEGAAGAAECRVPIEPTLRVEKPSLFVVTVEPPGGVMVSDRSRITAIAKTG